MIRMILRAGAAEKLLHAANTKYVAVIMSKAQGPQLQRPSWCLRAHTRWNLISSKSIHGVYEIYALAFAFRLGAYQAELRARDHDCR